MKRLVSVLIALVVMSAMVLTITPATNVTAAPNDPLLSMTRMDSYGPIVPDSSFVAYYTFANDGGDDAHDIKVVFGYELVEEGIMPPSTIFNEGLSQQQILQILTDGNNPIINNANVPFSTREGSLTSLTSINVGSEKIVWFLLETQDSAEVGSYDAPICVFYRDEDGHVQPSMSRLAVFEVGPEPGYTFVDIVTKGVSLKQTSRFTQETIGPGDEFYVSLGIKNHGEIAAQNIRVLFTYKVDQDTGSITTDLKDLFDIMEGAVPEDLLEGILGSSSPTTEMVSTPFTPMETLIQFIDVLEPQEEKTVVFKLKANREAEPTLYTVPVSILYQDNAGNEQPVTSDGIGIELQGQPVFAIAGVITDPSIVHKGDKYVLEVQIENIGTAISKSVVVLLGDNKKASLLGSMDSGDIGIAMFDLEADEVGTNNMSIVIEYLDSAGEKINLEGSLTTTIYEREGVNKLYVALGIIGAIILLVVVLIRRSRSQEE